MQDALWTAEVAATSAERVLTSSSAAASARNVVARYIGECAASKRAFVVRRPRGALETVGVFVTGKEFVDRPRNTYANRRSYNWWPSRALKRGRAKRVADACLRAAHSTTPNTLDKRGGNSPPLWCNSQLASMTTELDSGWGRSDGKTLAAGMLVVIGFVTLGTANKFIS